MKRLMFIALLANMVLTILAQSDFFYAPNGEKVNFKIREDKIVLKAKPGELIRKQQYQVIYSSLDDLDGISHIVTVDTKKRNLEELKQNQAIADAFYMLEYEDGTLQAITNQIFIQPKKGVSIKQCIGKTGLAKQLQTTELIIPEDNIYLLRLDVKLENVLSIARNLHETGLCEFAEPCFVKLIKSQNALYPQQWGLKNTGQYSGVAGMDIRAEIAWNSTRGNNIKVAVIDEGVDLLHADLQANLLTGYDATIGAPQGANGSPNSWNGHGTMCTGIIAAINNSIGIVGVASSAKVVPIRVAYDATSTAPYWTFNDSWAVNAFNYARNTAQVDVISCSWGGGSPSASITSAINNAANNGRNGKGCVVVFCSMNDSLSTVSYPANLPNVIAVGAIVPNGTRATYSNYGSDLDVVAPGSSIISTDISGTGGYNTSAGTAGDYHTGNGTSFAAPHVAGVAALVLAVNPSLTRSQVKAVIESTARKVGGYTYSTNTNHPNGTWHSEMGHGLVDAASAVIAASAIFTGPDIVPCSGTVTYSLPSGVTATWSVSSNLQIMSGQGTNSITVKARPISSATISGWITAGTVSKSVSIALPPFVTVTGASSTTTNGNICFQASPIFSASEGDYEWVVEPSSGASMSPWRHTNCITFNTPGSYSVGCRSYNACATGGSFSWTGVSVSSYYMVSQPASSKILTVSLAGSSANQDMLQVTRTVDYTLTNVATGAAVASGKMSASGGTLDFSSVPTGIYVLRIDTGSGTPETFKVILK